MAGRLLAGFRTSTTPSFGCLKEGVCLQISRRNAVTSAKGEILSNPSKVSFGQAKIVFTAAAGILIGPTLAKNGASWLEENEIFIPDDDDD